MCAELQQTCPNMSTYLQQQDEIVHRVVASVEIVAWAQPVVWVKVHFLVDTGVTEQVEQDLLRHAGGAEVIHFCRGRKSETHDTINSLPGLWFHTEDPICLDKLFTSNTPNKFQFSRVFVELWCQTLTHHQDHQYSSCFRKASIKEEDEMLVIVSPCSVYPLKPVTLMSDECTS